jgi:hypothetical protein
MMLIDNPLIHYRAKIEFDEHELLFITALIIQCYKELQNKTDEFYTLVDAVLIGHKLCKLMLNKFEMRQLRYAQEGRPKKEKSYKISMNKLEMIWLYNLTQGTALDDLRVNRLGAYIIADIPKENDRTTHI